MQNNTPCVYNYWDSSFSRLGFAVFWQCGPGIFYLFCHYKVCGKWAIFVAAVPFGLQRLILIEWASMKINACTIASLDWHRSKIRDLSSLKSISLDYWKWRQTAKKNSGFGCWYGVVLSLPTGVVKYYLNIHLGPRKLFVVSRLSLGNMLADLNFKSKSIIH